MQTSNLDPDLYQNPRVKAARVYIQYLCKGGEAGGRGETTKVMELGCGEFCLKKFKVLVSMGVGREITI